MYNFAVEFSMIIYYDNKKSKISNHTGVGQCPFS